MIFPKSIDNRRKCIELAIVCVLLVGIYLSCYWKFWSGDDYRWILNYYCGRPQPDSYDPTITTILSLNIPAAWSRACRLWQHLNGRFMCNFLNGLAAGLTRFEWAALNTTLFALLCGQVWILAGRKRDLLFPAVLLCVFFCLNDQTVLWPCGSANYLWPMVWTLAGWILFKRLPAEAERFNALRMVLFMVLGFVLGCGHELICLTTCFAMAYYWVRLLYKEHKLVLNSRLALSVGYGLGSLLTVLSPGNVERAGGGSFFAVDNIIFHIGWKIRIALLTLMASPAFDCLMVLAIVLLWRGVAKKRVLGSIAIPCVAFFVVLLLGGGQGRIVWSLQIFSIVSLLDLSREFWTRAIKIKVLLSIIGVAIVSVTAVRSVQGYKIYDSFIETCKTTNSPYYVRPPTEKSNFLFRLLDRSAPVDQYFFHYGSRNEDGIPSIFSRYQKIPPFVMVDSEMTDVLDRLRELSIPANRLHCEGEWYAVENADLIWSPYHGDMPHGVALTGHPLYAGYKPKSMKERILIRLRKDGAREVTGNGYPYEMMASNASLSGFVYSVGRGTYQVFIHDRNIPRQHLRKVDVSVSMGAYKHDKGLKEGK